MAANERRKSSTRGGKNKVPSFSINLSTTQNAQRSSTNPTPSQFQQPIPYTSATIPIHSQFQQPFSYAQNMYSNHPTSSGPHYNMSMPHPEMSSTQPPPGPQDDQSNRNYEETSQGSNANKVYVEPEGKTFYPNPTGVVHCITEIIRSKYDGAWSSWKKIPQEVRLMWFGDFGKRYHWKPEYNQTIRKNFEIRGAARLKDMLAEVREKNQMPGWINPDAWKGLVAYWNTPEFLAKSARNKQNRASDCGGMGASLHTGGSIPATEHKRRLAEKLDREPTLDELFLEIHTRDEGATWVDKRSANAYDRSTQNWWLKVQGVLMGYWPRELFSSLREGASRAGWGGDVYIPMKVGNPGMGSGHFPNEGFKKAAFIKQMNYAHYNSSWVAAPTSYLKKDLTSPLCFNITYHQDPDDNWGHGMFFGGPPNCPNLYTSA